MAAGAKDCGPCVKQGQHWSGRLAGVHSSICDICSCIYIYIYVYMGS